MMPTRKICELTVLTGLLIVLPAVGFTDEMRELTDEELDSVTAGTDADDESQDLVAFAFKKTTHSGKTIEADGSFQLVEATDRAAIGNLLLTEGAQDNLSSLININAVNSDVYVLLNLNINIDSNVGSVNQFNFNGLVPSLKNKLPRP